MKVDCTIFIPTHDSYGNNGHAHHVIPKLERHQVADAMTRILNSFQHFKPGMEFNFTIGED